MKLSLKQKTELIGKITLMVLTSGMVFLVIYFTIKTADSNHEEPTPPDYKIETDRGFEYPKY